MTKQKVKQITGIVVGYAVGTTISILVRSNTPEDTKTFQKVMVTIGSAAIASWLGRQVGEHIDVTIDELTDDNGLKII